MQYATLTENNYKKSFQAAKKSLVWLARYSPPCIHVLKNVTLL